METDTQAGTSGSSAHRHPSEDPRSRDSSCWETVLYQYARSPEDVSSLYLRVSRAAAAAQEQEEC